MPWNTGDISGLSEVVWVFSSADEGEFFTEGQLPDQLEYAWGEGVGCGGLSQCGCMECRQEYRG